jgi:hypothetical protein
VNQRQRHERPTLERTKPIRNWGTVINPGAPADAQLGPDLQNANRVLQDQMRSGEATARLFQAALGVRPGTADGSDLTRQMIRAWSDLMAFSFEFMARASGGPTPAPARAAERNAERADPAHAAAAGHGLRVAVEIESMLPARVTVDIRRRPSDSTLYVDRLQPHRTSAPPIFGTEITVAEQENLATVRLRIAPDQPAGVYNGVIVEESTSEPVGTISVVVLPSRQTTSPDAGR